MRNLLVLSLVLLSINGIQSVISKDVIYYTKYARLKYLESYYNVSKDKLGMQLTGRNLK